MKILCLHGMGTNADVFKAQTASFRALLPSHFMFDFLEGDHDCSAAEGIAEVYPEPYVCWYPSPPTLDRVADAHETIKAIVEEDGPFDGVMGFSQGAALAASILLHHELESPLAPPLFRFAVFICGSLPFSTSEQHGFDLTDVLTHHNDPLPASIEEWKGLDDKRVSLQQAYFTLPKSTIQHLTSTSGGTSSCSDNDDLTDSDSDCSLPETPATPQSLLENSAESKESSVAAVVEGIVDVSMTDPNIPVHRFHPALDKVRISIPTAHIYGKNDPYFEQSLQLVGLCQKSFVNVLDHGGAHDIPRSVKVNQSIASLIEKTVTRSEVMF